MSDVTYDVRQSLGVLASTGNGWKKELNIISWNGRDPKLDIREWSSDHSKMKKGITLSKNEASMLFFFLAKLDNDDVIDKSVDSDSMIAFVENDVSVLD